MKLEVYKYLCLSGLLPVFKCDIESNELDYELGISNESDYYFSSFDEFILNDKLFLTMELHPKNENETILREISIQQFEDDFLNILSSSSNETKNGNFSSLSIFNETKIEDLKKTTKKNDLIPRFEAHSDEIKKGVFWKNSKSTNIVIGIIACLFLSIVILFILVLRKQCSKSIAKLLCCDHMGQQSEMT